MKNRSPEIDAKIQDAPHFARPILERLRALFHEACPEIEETIKWGNPAFERKGLVAGMGAFKKHVSFGFWKTALLSDPMELFAGEGCTSIMALKFRDVSELPPTKS